MFPQRLTTQTNILLQFPLGMFLTQPLFKRSSVAHMKLLSPPSCTSDTLAITSAIYINCNMYASLFNLYRSESAEHRFDPTERLGFSLRNVIFLITCLALVSKVCANTFVIYRNYFCDNVYS